MVIWKYSIKDENRLYLPVNHKVLSVQSQGENICVWIMLDEDKPCTYRRDFFLIATGDEVPLAAQYFLGTVQLYDGYIIYHIFTDKEV